MSKTSSKLMFLAVFLSVGILVFSTKYIQAQNVDNSASAETINLYGQVINPEPDFYKSDKYLGPRWSQLKFLMPEVLPNPEEGDLSAEALCDLMFNLSSQYLMKWETASAKIGYALEPIFPDEEHEWRLLDQAGMRLYSRKTEDLKQLLEWLPDMQEEIMATKEFTMKNQLTAMIFDASYENCKPHAERKGYKPYSSYWVQDYHQ